jgi:hypothetical protein
MPTLLHPVKDNSIVTVVLTSTSALHPLRHFNLRLGRPPIPPAPSGSSSDSLPLQPGSAQNHRPGSLPLPHPGPDTASPSSLEPGLHGSHTHRSPSTCPIILVPNTNLHNLAQQQRTRLQRRRLRLPTPPPRRRGQKRSRQSDGLHRRGVPGYHGFLLVHAGDEWGMEFCLHGWLVRKRRAVLFRHLDAVVWRGCGAGEQDYGRG